MTKSKYEGVVVFYKPDDSNYKNIESYINELDKLYIVDNTPNEDLSNKFVVNKKIEYIPLNENKGIAYALNVGAKRAIKDQADWLLTMDQDSSFQENALREMIEFIGKLAGDKYLQKVVGNNIDNIGIISPRHMTVQHRNEQLVGIDHPLEIMTSGNLVNLNAYKVVDGFKEWMFIDCVDFEFCLNLKKHGYDVLQLNFSKLNHQLGDTKEVHFLGKKMFVDNHSAMRRYYIVRNRHYLYDMYHNDFSEYCNLEKKSTKKEALKIILFEKNKIKKLSAMLRGYRDYKKGKLGGTYEK